MIIITSPGFWFLLGKKKDILKGKQASGTSITWLWQNVPINCVLYRLIARVTEASQLSLILGNVLFHKQFAMFIHFPI